MSSITAHTRTRSEYRDFLAAITAAPLDDGVRLVFADWLDEQGDIDRAAYIRMEIERATLPEYDDRALLLKYEADALLQRHWREWVADLPEWLRPVAEFERGLPGKIAPPVARFLQHANDDWTCVPIHELTLSGNDGGRVAFRELCCRPMVRQFTALALRQLDLTSADVNELAVCPHWRGLLSLDLGWNRLDAAGVQMLAGSEMFSSLRELALAGNPIERAGAAALAQARFLPSLEGLHLYRCGLDADAIAALLDGPVDRLRDLDLGGLGSSLEEHGARVIAQCPRLAGLRRLNLAYTLRTEAEVLTLAKSPHLTALEDLWLDIDDGDNQNVTLDTLRAIADAPLIQHLTEFAPWWGAFGDDGARLIANMSALTNVRSLNLTYCGLTPAGLAALLASPYLNRVTALEVDSNELGDEGVAMLARSPWLPRLRELNLYQTDVCADGVRSLASADVSRLLRLVLSNNPLEDAGVIALTVNRWPALRELTLSSCSISSAGAMALATEGVFPNVVYLYLSRNWLGSTGAAAIANGPGLGSLCRLELAHNGIGNAGAVALANSRRRFTDLGVNGNDISPDMVGVLRNSRAVAEARSLSVSQ